MREAITHERLLELVTYQPDTGKFFWNVATTSHARKINPGDEAYGTLNKSGHIVIGLDRRPYLAHRVAWFYVRGVWPSLLDHKNRDPRDNRIANLREATKSQNAINGGPPRNNTSGFRGVSLRCDRKKWCAHIWVRGARLNLGSFDTKEAAALAYQVAAEHHFGEFARAA